MEDRRAERRFDISYETVRRWFLTFGEPMAWNLRQLRPTSNHYWHLSEMVIGHSSPVRNSSRGIEYEIVNAMKT